jgi:hypothetical protein
LEADIAADKAIRPVPSQKKLATNQRVIPGIAR